VEERHREALRPILNRGLIAAEDAKVFRMLDQAAGIPIKPFDIEVETARDFVTWVCEHDRECPDSPCNWTDADDVEGKRWGFLCMSCGARYLIKLVRLKNTSQGHDLMAVGRKKLLAEVRRGIVLNRFERLLKDSG
jgi:hypothetical protein